MSINELTNRVTMLDVVNTSGETAKNTNDIVSGNTSTFSSSLCSLGFPSSRSINIINSLTLGTEPGKESYLYVAPANGYILIRTHTKNTTDYLRFYNNGCGLCVLTNANSNNDKALVAWLPFKKGQQCCFYTTKANWVTDEFQLIRFIYAEGENA